MFLVYAADGEFESSSEKEKTGRERVFLPTFEVRKGTTWFSSLTKTLLGSSLACFVVSQFEFAFVTDKINKKSQIE